MCMQYVKRYPAPQRGSLSIRKNDDTERKARNLRIWWTASIQKERLLTLVRSENYDVMKYCRSTNLCISFILLKHLHPVRLAFRHFKQDMYIARDSEVCRANSRKQSANVILFQYQSRLFNQQADAKKRRLPAVTCDDKEIEIISCKLMTDAYYKYQITLFNLFYTLWNFMLLIVSIYTLNLWWRKNPHDTWIALHEYVVSK